MYSPSNLMPQRSADIFIDPSLIPPTAQTLRTALSLSLVSGRSFRIDKIRSDRPKPGLLRHHLATVRAAAAICEAKVDGDAVGSQTLTFIPRSLNPGEYHFALGTGGSSTLLFLTLLPALLRALGPFSITLDGPTHCPDAPPFEFLEHALLPLLHRMGAKVHLSLERAGFHPAAGGRFFVNAEPPSQLTPLHLTERGRPVRCLAKAVVAALPGEIALRELEIVRNAFNWPQSNTQIRQLPEEYGPGNAITAELHYEPVTEVIYACGLRGLPAEAVAEDCVRQVKQYLSADAPLSARLAEHMLVPITLIGGTIRALAINQDGQDALKVIGAFLGVHPHVERNDRGDWSIGAAPPEEVQ